MAQTDTSQARPVTRVLVGWLDRDGAVRPQPKAMSDVEATELLADDIERFGEPAHGE